jgi:arylsulfatase A-like enzyme
MRRHGYRTVTTVTEAMADAVDLLDGFEDIERRNKKVEAIHNGYGMRVVDKLDELNESRRPWFYFVHTCELHPDRQCDPRFQSRRYGRDFYDRCLSSVDYHLGPIFEAVDWVNTAVVVFGDHGDNLLWEPSGEFASKVMNRLRGDGRVSLLWRLRDAFYRAGLYGPWKGILRNNALFHHDYHLYRFLTHSPLMIAAPGLAAGRRIDAAMSSVDMMPTLFDYLGMPKVPAIDGFDFGPLLRGDTVDAPSRAIYQEVVTDFVLKRRDASTLRIPLLNALIQDGWKYIESRFDPKIEPELYNMVEDPRERDNCYRKLRESELVKNLSAKLRAIEGTHVPSDLTPSAAAFASALLSPPADDPFPLGVRHAR